MAHTQDLHEPEFDAHGHKDHGHVIVSRLTLRSILAALLFLTFLTVFLSRAEVWIGETFNFVVPQLVNVFVALAIAVVKTILVVLFFMQLKYDNPLNSMIFIFTILTVACFLGFTMIDLGNRGTLDRTKAQQVVVGGTGGVKLADGQTPLGPITAYAKSKAAESGKKKHEHDHEDEPQRLYGSITDAGFATPIPARGSNADFSRPVKGVSLPGFAPETHDDHDDHTGGQEGDEQGESN